MNVKDVFNSYEPPVKWPKYDIHLTEDDDEMYNMKEVKAKRFLNQLDKRVRNNQEMRTKFSGQPLKFLDSGLGLCSRFVWRCDHSELQPRYLCNHSESWNAVSGEIFKTCLQLHKFVSKVAVEYQQK